MRSTERGTVPSLFFKLKALTDALHADDGLTTAERGVLRDLVERGPMSAPQLAALSVRPRGSPRGDDTG